MFKCSKCFTEEECVETYTDLKDTWTLCFRCNEIFDNKAFLLREFMKEDFGKFPIQTVSKNIINARKRRALGENPWKS